MKNSLISTCIGFISGASLLGGLLVSLPITPAILFGSLMGSIAVGTTIGYQIGGLLGRRSQLIRDESFRMSLIGPIGALEELSQLEATIFTNSIREYAELLSRVYDASTRLKMKPIRDELVGIYISGNRVLDHFRSNPKSFENIKSKIDMHFDLYLEQALSIIEQIESLAKSLEDEKLIESARQSLLGVSRSFDHLYESLTGSKLESLQIDIEVLLDQTKTY